MTDLPQEFERYQRQIALDKFGISSQKNLQNSSLVIVGAGGVGSAALPILVGSGVGNITIIDCDTVSITNLHRQTIYSENEIGKSKVLLAKEKLSKLNSSININAIELKISSVQDLQDILKGTDICIDATDSFATRFIISDTCKKLQIPQIYASAQGYVSQNILFYKNFYLRDFLEDESLATEVPQRLPVFSAAAHLSGIWAATEAIKYLAKIVPFKTSLFKSYNLLENRFTSFEF